MSTIIGRDFPNRLALTATWKDFRNLKDMKDSIDVWIRNSDIYLQDFYKDFNCAPNIIQKNDDYNFEDALNDYIKAQNKLKYPIYIFKDEKWFQCSPETNMMLIPCEGNQK